MANKTYTYTEWDNSLDYPLLNETEKIWDVNSSNLSSKNLICDKYSGDTVVSGYGCNHIEAFFVFSATSIVTASTNVSLDKIEYLSDDDTVVSTNIQDSLYSASTENASYTGGTGYEILNKNKTATTYDDEITLYKCIENVPFSGCTDKHYIFRIPIQNYYYPNNGTATKRKLTFTITFQTKDEEIKKIQTVTITQVGSRLIS